jgi:hypothetical protein
MPPVVVGIATEDNVDTVKGNVGSDSDSASTTGSVHAKIKDLKANPSSIIKSVQTGYLSGGSSLAAGSGEDARYIDITISSVNTSKCLIMFVGGRSDTTATAMSEVSASNTYKCTARLTSSTNLRIASNLDTSSFSNIAGRWQIIEYV